MKPINEVFSIEEFTRFYNSQDHKYYIYGLLNNGVPFYVGKGEGLRWIIHLFNKSSNKSLKKEIDGVLSSGQKIQVIIYCTTDSESEAYSLETAKIVELGRKNFKLEQGILVNKILNSFQKGETIYSNFQYIINLLQTNNQFGYDYSLIKPEDIEKGKYSKISIICPNHGVFYQTINNHLYNRQRCPKCVGGTKIENPEKHYHSVLSEFKDKHPNMILVSEISKFYENNNHHTGLLFYCRYCRNFSQKFIGHIKEGKGCGYCHNGGVIIKEIQPKPYLYYLDKSKTKPFNKYLDVDWAEWKSFGGTIPLVCKVCGEEVSGLIRPTDGRVFTTRWSVDTGSELHHKRNCSNTINKKRVIFTSHNRDEWDYKEITIKELLDKYTEGFEVEIASEDGWVPVNEIYYKGQKECVEISTPDFTLECSENHLINIANEWWDYESEPIYQFASDFIEYKNFIHTAYGIQPVVSAKRTSKKPVWDISVGHENQRYYASGLSSHNSPGCGKTTSLRILANAIICDHESQEAKPCLECKSCLDFLSNNYPDYIEVDAGQYNKVEDVNRLIEIAKIYPVHSNKFRIILIDEAHRLSNAAWDSLLKLLEEGRTKTIFMFATTEGDKIRRAIHSRSIAFQLKPLSVQEIQAELIRVCKLENIQYDIESIQSIAYANRGRMRDALKTMDTYYRAYREIKNIQLTTPEEHFCSIINHAFFNRIQEATEVLDQLVVDSLNLGAILCNTITAIYCYPQQITSGIPENVLSSIKTLLKADIKRLIEIYMEYKPQTYEQVKLFLFLISELGVSKANSQSQQQTKRQLIRTREKPKVIDDDDI